MKDLDAQFLCKDCARFNLCQYYDRRKEDSYICKYFHLVETYGMTNGEVIKALFPNIDVRLFTDANIVQVKILNLDSYWWNAPYKAEKGGEE